jgi:hypothetical protein
MATMLNTVASLLHVDLALCQAELYPAQGIAADPTGMLHHSLRGWWNSLPIFVEDDTAAPP